MQKKIYNPITKKEEYIDFGMAAAGETASDFHASGQYHFQSKGIRPRPEVLCFNCSHRLLPICSNGNEIQIS